MLKVRIPVEAGNAAIQGGKLPKALRAVMGQPKPEAAHFVAEDGVRSALIFFDMADLSDIPSIAEPFFMGMNAKVDPLPVMNAEGLRKGLSRLG